MVYKHIISANENFEKGRVLTNKEFFVGGRQDARYSK